MTAMSEAFDKPVFDGNTFFYLKQVKKMIKTDIYILEVICSVHF